MSPSPAGTHRRHDERGYDLVPINTGIMTSQLLAREASSPKILHSSLPEDFSLLQPLHNAVPTHNALGRQILGIFAISSLNQWRRNF
jgi:hypothetical protein